MEETTNENKPISEISAETKAAIKRKTAEPLPINPAAKGMKAEDIRRALYAAITDDEYSVIKELERVISEANTAFTELENKVDNLDTQISLPSWVGPEKPKYTASEVGAAKPEDVSTAVAGEKGEREQADEALGGRIDTEASNRQSADEALGTRITNEENARSSALNSVRASAIGLPTYNTSTGIMTFETLDNGITKTYDFPIEKIIDNVTLSADGKSFVFTFHNSEPITLPFDNITLPAWVKDVSSATGEQLLIPPTTEAVNNIKYEVLSSIHSRDKGLMRRIEMLELYEENTTSRFRNVVRIWNGYFDTYAVFYSDTRNVDIEEVKSKASQVLACRGTYSEEKNGKTNSIYIYEVYYNESSDTWSFRGHDNNWSALLNKYELNVTSSLIEVYTYSTTETVYEMMGGKLDKKPFTYAESGKNVSIGPNGELVASEMPSGNGGNIQIEDVGSYGEVTMTGNTIQVIFSSMINECNGMNEPGIALINTNKDLKGYSIITHGDNDFKDEYYYATVDYWDNGCLNVEAYGKRVVTLNIDDSTKIVTVGVQSVREQT